MDQVEESVPDQEEMVIMRLPVVPVPSSLLSDASQLYTFLPEEHLAATEQELRTALVDLQSHDQAPPPSSHTLRSLTTTFLGEPHAPAKPQDDDLGTHSSHMSHVMFHMSHVKCHMSHVKKKDKVVEGLL